jgi:hypothetical protein
VASGTRDKTEELQPGAVAFVLKVLLDQPQIDRYTALVSNFHSWARGISSLEKYGQRSRSKENTRSNPNGTKLRGLYTTISEPLGLARNWVAD